MKVLMTVAVIAVFTVAACAQTRSAYTDAQIEAALIAHEKTWLLSYAATTDQGHPDAAGMSMDVWWRLSEGRHTAGVREYLPKITDRQLLAFLKRYAISKRGVDPRSLLSSIERASTIYPGESVTSTVTLGAESVTCAMTIGGVTHTWQANSGGWCDSADRPK
jgi:hypothetical protein